MDLGFRFALVGILSFLALLAFYLLLTLGSDMTRVEEMPQRDIIYDRDAEIYSVSSGENRTVVALDEVSDDFIDALLAREDTRFYHHPGIDPIGIARAIYMNIRAGSIEQGGSTITQQLARNTFNLSGRNLHRKLLEGAYALRIELAFSKEEILEHYVNRIYYGNGIYGIELASQRYFGKPAGELTLAEAATLAGLIRSPNNLSPLRNPEDAIAVRREVLDRMKSAGMITGDEYKAAWAAPLTAPPAPRTEYTVEQIREDYATDFIRREMEVLMDEGRLQKGGMKIYSTIDPQLQAAAQRVLDEQLTQLENQSGWRHPKRGNLGKDGEKGWRDGTPYVQGAVVIIENETGAIRALVGGRDFAESRYNRAISSERPIGSIFKPFVYTAAFERGLLPHTLISDNRITASDIRSERNSKWSPANSDGEYTGLQQADYGLYKSRNTMTVRAGEYAGLDNVRQLAHNAGLRREAIPNRPVSYLGAFDVSLLNITTAYTIYANRGFRPKPFVINRVATADGETVFRATRAQIRAAKPFACWLTNLVLQRTFTQGTASNASGLGFDRYAAGKTGTTDNYQDAWFIGYTTSLTCGVWVGFDQPREIRAHGYASEIAVPIWVGVMKRADPARYPGSDFLRGETAKYISLCGLSGKRSTKKCIRSKNATKYEFPESVEVPADYCPIDKH